MQIFFVILHYQNYEVTIRCIQCIKNLKYAEQCKIVVVDNASPNKSGEKLKEKFDNDNQIIFVLNEENYGFAKGNNIGYIIAKDLKADIVILQNSDIMVEQYEFLDIILKSNLLNDFHVIGPDIINLADIHQNPLRKCSLSEKDIEKMIRYNLFLSKIYKNNFIGKSFIKIKNYFKKKRNLFQEDVYQRENVILHGACLIFTKKWIDCEDIAFLPITHMFFEEDILYEYIHEKGYRTVYFPVLKVVHEEDSSIEFLTKNDLEKRKYINKNMLASLNTLKDIKENIRLRGKMCR